MPERVRVGPFLYEVRVEDEAFEDETGGLLCGQANHNNG
jgi:hypothetical protein